MGRARGVLLVGAVCLAVGAFVGTRAGGLPDANGSVRVVVANSSAPASDCTRGSSVNIVAHQDDDLLFLSPDLLRDIRAGKCEHTIFVTAGDASERVGGTADQRRRYWMAREAGSRAAYAFMAGVTNSWKRSYVRVNGRRLVMFTLAHDPRISEVFMRLPDGNPDGSGSKFHNHESLLKLRDGEIHQIRAIDRSTVYTKVALLSTVTKLVQLFHPDTIRTQDYVTPDFEDVNDHADHTMTAILAHAASDAYRPAHRFIGYVDYDIETRPANLSGRDLATKQSAFYLYDRYDSQLPCYTQALRAADGANGNKHGCNHYAAWLSRQYRVSIGPAWNQRCLVPDIESGGSPLAEGALEALIRAQGCAVGTVTEAPDDVVPQGYVVSESPNPGPRYLPQGTKVSITVSTGPQDQTGTP